LERESQQQPKVYHSGPILMTQNLVASMLWGKEYNKLRIFKTLPKSFKFLLILPNSFKFLPGS
jgi:hypothetical protein